VTTAIALFVRLEFCGAVCGDANGFLGNRPRDVWAFFLMLGLTNLAKGLIFGTLMVIIPAGGYLLWNRNWGATRRYVWLWGWLTFVAVSLAWPVFVVARYPEMLRFWNDHYLGRVYRGYLKEPAWYYAVALLRDLAPWSPMAVYGLWLTARSGFRERSSAERFLWAWAVLPPLVFSLADAKHHHYMLYCLAPLAVLAAVGAVRLWKQLLAAPRWLRQPAWTLLTIGAPTVAVAVIFRDKFRGPAWVPPVLATGVVAVGFLMAVFVTRRDGRWAMGGFVLTLAVALSLLTRYQAAYVADYDDDNAFLAEAQSAVPPDRPLLTLYEDRELETFWAMYYSDARVQLLRHAEDLPQKVGGAAEAYVLARREDAADFAAVGHVEEVLASRHTRSERQAGDRRVLYRVTLPNGERAAARTELTGGE
jgi:4-amino-4-deoxy-L-arabinose transferase-like glycosyltransferase